MDVDKLEPQSPLGFNALAESNTLASEPPTAVIMDDGSATESDDDMPVLPAAKSKAAEQKPSVPAQVKSSPSPSPGPSTKKKDFSSGDSDSPPPPTRPPAKKAKAAASSSDDDSDDERQRRSKSGNGAKRGTRQPIKRGGKRF